MNRIFIAGIAAIALLGGGAWWYFSQDEVVPEVEPAVVDAPAVEEPGIRNPVPEVARDQPLPGLSDSDQPLLSALEALIGPQAVLQHLIPKDLVRHIVVTIDNLPRKKIALPLRPVAPTQGQFVTAASGDTLTLGAANAARYAPFIKLVQATDTQAIANVYLRFYPLFQEAYEGLGYPSQYFNDRLVEVIDHLLEAPDLTGPIALSRPSVMYIYADPALEALSAGQKTLIRMGGENEAVVKAKLRELRTAVAAKKP